MKYLQKIVDLSIFINIIEIKWLDTKFYNLKSDNLYPIYMFLCYTFTYKNI